MDVPDPEATQESAASLTAPRGMHADAAARRIRGHGEELRLELGPPGAAVRLRPFATHAAGGDDEYPQESSYWHAGLPDGDELTVTVAWPAIGLDTVAVVPVPDLAGLARTAVPLR